MKAAGNLHVFHLHNGHGDHADGQTYEIAYSCDAHVQVLECADGAEYVRPIEVDDGDTCDLCESKTWNSATLKNLVGSVVGES